MSVSSCCGARWHLAVSALSTVVVAAACSTSSDRPGRVDAGPGGRNAPVGSGGAVSGGSAASGGVSPSTGTGGSQDAGNGDPSGGGSPGGGGATGSGNGTGSGGLPDGGGTSGSGGLPGTGSQSGSGGKLGECISVSRDAEKVVGGKADVIWAVDTSGSMIDELNAVQNNLNAFSSFIVGTGIDVHVVAIAVAVKELFGVPTPGLCIAPPLGSGASCFNAGDSRPPVYLHVDQNVDSHDALRQLMTTYPRWQGAIRPDSTKTFVVVTDNDANAIPTPAEFKAFFDNAFTSSTWRFSGIYCRGVSANCANPGNNYDALLTPSGGVWADLGVPNPDWSAVFKKLADAIVADAKSADCEWQLPPPPTGSTFAKDKVNVDFTGTSGVKETLFKVTRETCQNHASGWFYDSETAPTKVIACPQSCAKIQADDNAKVEIAYGCASKSPIP